MMKAVIVCLLLAAVAVYAEDDNEVFNGDDSKVLVEVEGSRYDQAKREATASIRRAFKHTYLSWFSDAAAEARKNAISASKNAVNAAKEDLDSARDQGRQRRAAAQVDLDRATYLHSRLMVLITLKTAENTGAVYREMYRYKAQDKSEEAMFARERAQRASSTSERAFAATVRAAKRMVKSLVEKIANLMRQRNPDRNAIQVLKNALSAARRRAASILARVAAQRKAVKASTYSCADMSGDAREARAAARAKFDASAKKARTARDRTQRAYDRMNARTKISLAGKIALTNARRARRGARRAVRNAEAHYNTVANCIGAAAQKLIKSAAKLFPKDQSADANELRRAAQLSKQSTLRSLDRAQTARSRTIANSKFDVKSLQKSVDKLRSDDKSSGAMGLRADLIEAKIALKSANKRNVVGIANGRSIKLSLEAASYNCGTMTPEAKSARQSARVARNTLVQKAISARSFARRQAKRFGTRDVSPKAIRARRVLAKARATVRRALRDQEKYADNDAVCVTPWAVYGVQQAAGLRKGDNSENAKSLIAEAALLRAGAEEAFVRALNQHAASVQAASIRAKKLAQAVADFSRRDVSDRANNARANARGAQRRLKDATARQTAFAAVIKAARLAIIAAGYGCSDFSEEKIRANRAANKANARAIKAATKAANKAGKVLAKASKRAGKFDVSDVSRAAINARRAKRNAQKTSASLNALVLKLSKAAAKDAKRQQKCARKGAKVLKKRAASCTKNCGKIRKFIAKAKKVAKKLAKLVKKAAKAVKKAVRAVLKKVAAKVVKVAKKVVRKTKKIARKIKALKRKIQKLALKKDDGAARRAREALARLRAEARRRARKAEAERRRIARETKERIARLRKESERARIKAQREREALAAKLLREKTEAQAQAFRAAEARVTGRILSTVQKIDKELGSLETKEAIVHTKLTNTARAIINAEVDVLKAAKDAKEAAKNAAAVTRKNTADTNAALSYAKDAASRASKNAAKVAAKVAIDAVSRSAAKRLRSATKEARTKQYRKDLKDMAPHSKRAKRARAAAKKAAAEKEGPSALDQAADIKTMKILQKFKLQRKLRDAPVITKKDMKAGADRLINAKLQLKNGVRKYKNTCNGPTCAFQINVL